MMEQRDLQCDGCGQLATPEHVARRLRRLEWSTRYRPVHISTLLLGAFSPAADADFLYAPSGEFGGEAGHLLRAMGITTPGKTGDTVLVEVQRAGLFLTHVLGCPFEGDDERTKVLSNRLPALASRIRRSLKPKRVILLDAALDPLANSIVALELGCPVILNKGKPFALGPSGAIWNP